MLIALGLLMALAPFAAIIGAIWLLDRWDRWRRDAIERQMSLTEAIHRQFGAIVAPVVTRRFWGRWQVVIAVPFARPEIVAGLLALAQQAVPPSVRRSPRAFRIVLTPQEGPPARAHHATAA